MAVRQCPSCLTVVPAGRVVAHSDDLVCPGCQRPLEISALSRNLVVTAGLLAATGVWRVTSDGPRNGYALGWVLPIVYAILAFGAVAPLLLILTADLRFDPAVEMAPEASSPADAPSHFGDIHHP